MAETTSMRVSEAVNDTVKRIKRERGHTNMDSAMREILMKADIEIKTEKSPWEGNSDE